MTLTLSTAAALATFCLSAVSLKRPAKEDEIGTEKTILVMVLQHAKAYPYTPHILYQHTQTHIDGCSLYFLTKADAEMQRKDKFVMLLVRQVKKMTSSQHPLLPQHNFM
jgi:hypothetical protein